MMEQHKSDPQLFNYAVNLEKCVRANLPKGAAGATAYSIAITIESSISVIQSSIYRFLVFGS
jgi:hypothetical protein